jgi:hypothetical protein
MVPENQTRTHADQHVAWLVESGERPAICLYPVTPLD